MNESCRRCGKPLIPCYGTFLGYGSLFAPGAFCSPACRDLNDQVWGEWYAPQRQGIYLIP